MKGLRGLVAVGLLTGGVLGAGCMTEDSGQPQDGHKSPIQQKYQTPAADEAQPLGDARMVHPSTEHQSDQAGREHGAYLDTRSADRENTPPMGGGTAAPNAARMPEEYGIGGSGTSLPREGLGLGLADSYQGGSAQGGSAQGGSAQGGSGAADPGNPNKRGQQKQPHAPIEQQNTPTR